MNRVSPIVLVCSLGLVLLTGCSSPWKENYEPMSVLRFAPSQEVVVRRVPYQRVDQTLTQLENEVRKSDTHPDEWGEDRLGARDAKLLAALQVSEDPSRCTLLGRSVFYSTEDVRPDDGTLAGFAKQLGATYAIWSSAYMGKSEVVQRESVTVTGSSWGSKRDRHDASYHETAYVPIVIEADEYAWIVYYVRVD